MINPIIQELSNLMIEISSIIEDYEKNIGDFNEIPEELFESSLIVFYFCFLQKISNFNENRSNLDKFDTIANGSKDLKDLVYKYTGKRY